jgi:hypothetical protein
VSQQIVCDECSDIMWTAGRGIECEVCGGDYCGQGCFDEHKGECDRLNQERNERIVMSLNWGGNVVQMPRRDPDWSEMAEMFDVPHASEDKDFADFYREKRSGPRMLTNALVLAFCVALGIAVCVWRFRVKTFVVCATVHGSAYLGHYQADTAEEAIAQASLEHAMPSLCHQCSSVCEDPEYSEFEAEEVQP